MAAIWNHPVELRDRALRPYWQPARKPVIAQLARELDAELEARQDLIRQNEADCGERRDSSTTEAVEQNRRLRAETLRPAPAAASVPIISRSLRHTSRGGCRTTPRAM